jgi:hypothetical protein
VPNLKNNFDLMYCKVTTMKYIGSHNMCYFLKYYGRRLNWPESVTIAKVFVRSSSVICLQIFIFIFILKFSAAEYKNFPIPSFFV